MTTTINNQLDFDDVRGKRSVRMELARASHYYFFHLYMGEYVKYPTADFQRDLYAITEDESIKHAVIVAFRGSGKSTIITLSYPMWAVLGKQQKKFVLILSQTQSQARMHLVNIKREFEANELLRKDFGPMEQESDEWGSFSLVLPNLNARISAASSEQSIRGIRHGAYRPDLIIADDVEDMQSVKTQEGRNKTFNWFTGDILPVGDQGTKILTVGNLLHEDSLLMRLKEGFANGSFNGIYRTYPIIDGHGQPLWLGKFNTYAGIKDLQKTVGHRIAWLREYNLTIVPDEDQLVLPEWIRHYDQLPTNVADYRYSASAVDLAISQSNTADYTAIVSAKVYGVRENLKIYILPNIVNKRLDFPTTLEYIRLHHNTVGGKVYIEDVAYQQSAVQQLQLQGLSAEGVNPRGQDKRMRLATITHLIQQGKVVFPSHGAELLIQQLLGFGVEKHDDLVDAFTLLLHQIMRRDQHIVRVFSEKPFGW